MRVPRRRGGIIGCIPGVRGLFHLLDLKDAETIAVEHAAEREALAVIKFRESAGTQLDSTHAYAKASHQMIIDLQNRLVRLEEALNFYKWACWISPIFGFIMTAIFLSQCRPRY